MYTITAQDVAATPFYVEQRLRHNAGGCQLYFPAPFTRQVGFPLDAGRDQVAIAVPDGCVVLLPERPRTPLCIEIGDLSRIDNR